VFGLFEGAHHFAPEGVCEVGEVAGFVIDGDVEVEAGHFVGGAGAPEDALRGAAGVAGVGRGVIVEDLHFEAGAGGELEGSAELVDVLPVEVPIGDGEEGAAESRRGDGPGAELASDEVGVGDDLPEGDIDGEDEVIADAVVCVAGGNVDAAGGERDVEEFFGGGSGGEPDGEFALVLLGLAGGVVVDLEDEVGAGGDADGGGGGHVENGVTGGPAAETGGGEEAWGTEAGVAGAGGFGVEMAGGAGGVEEEESVVDDAAVAGEEGEAVDEAGGGEAGGDDETAVVVAALGGNIGGEGHAEAGVGGGGGRGWGGGIPLARAAGHALLDPRGDVGDFGGGETAFVLEAKAGAGGLPGGHVALCDDEGDLAGVFAGGFVGIERKGADLAGAMAREAMLLEDAGDAGVEGGGVTQWAYREEERQRESLRERDRGIGP